MGSVLFTSGGVKPLENFIQLLKKNHLQVYLRIFSSHHFSKTLNQLIVLFRAFKFSAASFISVTSLAVTVLNLDAILALIEIHEMLPWQFCNFTREIVTLKFRGKIRD